MGSLGLVDVLSRAFSPIQRLLKNKYYIDELYGALFVTPTGKFAELVAWFDNAIVDHIFVDGFGWVATLWSWFQSWFDDHIVDGAVDGAGWSAETLGATLRRMQNGLVQNYLLIITMALVVLMMGLESIAGKH